MNPITDWTFYAVAVPAVLLLGISKSGFGAGFGSLAVPLMAEKLYARVAEKLKKSLVARGLLGIGLKKVISKKVIDGRFDAEEYVIGLTDVEDA